MCVGGGVNVPCKHSEVLPASIDVALNTMHNPTTITIEAYVSTVVCKNSIPLFSSKILGGRCLVVRGWLWLWVDG